MPQVLLVDDEEPLRQSLSYALRKEGYEVHCAADGAAGLQMAQELQPDLILLDVMLPVLDGYEVCRRLRAQSSIPVLMLTAKDQEVDKIVGLELGADDYITKPFSVRELVARMKAVLRRGSGQVVSYGTIRGGPVVMDLDRHEVRVRDRVVELSPKEFQLLRALISNQGHVLPRERLMESVWGEAYEGDYKTLDVHIRWLRAKIEREPSAPEHIITVRGVGYRYE